MHLQQYLALNTLVSSSLAIRLFASSFSGDITTLEVSGKVITPVFANNGSAPQPTWVEEHKGIIYAADENFVGPNGSIAAYTKSHNGELIQIDLVESAAGPVSEVVINDGKALTTAHFAGSAVQNFAILPNGALSLLQTFLFTLDAPGPNAARQEAPHPHQALTDPTGSFIAVPDLGADFIRLFKIDHYTSLLAEQTSVIAPPGSGPRHGDFLTSEHGTFYFLLTELTNEVISYKVTYGENNESIHFQEVFRQSQFGPDSTFPESFASEIFVSPDNRFVITASRGAPLFNVTIPGLAEKVPSDTLQVFEINQETGELAFKQLAPAGGSFPRHFSISQDGKYVAVGLQQSGRVVLIERNVEDGKLGDFVAAAEGLGEVNCVIFDERKLTEWKWEA